MKSTIVRLINIEELGSGMLETGRDLQICEETIWNNSGISLEEFSGECNLRHKNGKWYAAILRVEKSKLGLEEEGMVDIINVKCEPDMVGLLTQTYGFLSGYHMNKKYWITILLDGTVSEAKILDFLDMSYDLIDGNLYEK